MKIGIIGMGHMGQAVKLGLQKAGFTNIVTSNRAVDNAAVIDSSNVIFLTVKPDICKSVIEDFNRDKLIISLVAGVSFAGVNFEAIRLMSSLLIAQNKGINVAWVNKNVSSDNWKKADNLLSRLAKTKWVKTETEIDELTLTIGCGPGWMSQIIADVAEACGDEEIAKCMFRDTIDYLDSTGLLAQKLAENVATEGGVTKKIVNALDFKVKLQWSFGQGYTRIKELRG